MAVDHLGTAGGGPRCGPGFRTAPAAPWRRAAADLLVDLLAGEPNRDQLISR